MDGQSGCKCAAASTVASTMTGTDPDLAAATSPNASTQAEAAVQAQSPGLRGRFPIYPCKA